MTHEEVFVGKLVAIPTDTSNEEYVVESKEDTIESHEDKPQEMYKKEE